MRRIRKRRHSEELGEPEILPMMNVLFMLVMVLMGMSAFLPLGVISADAPKLASAGAPTTGHKQGIGLTIMLLKTGINISANGVFLKGESTPLIPKVPFGDTLVYNFEELGKKLSEIKKEHPSETNVMIMSDADVIYDDVIHTMDATRELKGQVLFPDVSFIPGAIQ